MPNNTPVIITENGKAVLHGVVHGAEFFGGSACAKPLPSLVTSIYTNVYAMMDFITDVLVNIFFLILSM